MKRQVTLIALATLLAGTALAQNSSTTIGNVTITKPGDVKNVTTPRPALTPTIGAPLITPVAAPRDLPDGWRHLQGRITAPSNVRLPAGSKAQVTIEEMNRRGQTPVYLKVNFATTSLSTPYTLRYSTFRLNPQNIYVVKAKVFDRSGRTLYYSKQAYQVPTQRAAYEHPSGPLDGDAAGTAMTRVQLQGQDTLPGAPGMITALLSDPQALAGCVPSVQRTELLGPQQVRLWVEVGWRGQQITVPLELVVTGSNPPTIQLSAQGLGYSAALELSVRLGDSEGQQTHCEWQAGGHVTGPATLLRGHAIQDGAEQVIRQTIRNLRRELEQRAVLLA